MNNKLPFLKMILPILTISFTILLVSCSSDYTNDISDPEVKTATTAKKTVLAAKKILILAPHNDDEALGCAGIIEQAITNGDQVKVVVAVCYNNSTRIQETINAMASLGVSSSDLIFLGYPDWGKSYSVSFLYKLYYAPSETTVIGAGTTKGFDPNFQDYHYTKFGSHGTYTKATFRQDIESIVNDYLPTEVYVTSFYDLHGDHSAFYSFAKDAIINAGYSTSLFTYLVHDINEQNTSNYWPQRETSLTSVMRTYNAPGFSAQVPALDWTKKILVPVPTDMLLIPRNQNRKTSCIALYPSQNPAAYNNYLNSFVKTDELFWKEDFPVVIPDPVKIDDRTPTITYLGTWSNTSNSSYFMSTGTYSTTAASYSQFTFTSTNIKWYGVRGSDHGKADVYIDNVYDATVDCYGSGWTANYLLYTKTGLSPGAHTIKVVVRSDKNPSSTYRYVEIDSFDINS